MSKSFVAITTETYKGKLVLISTSKGKSIFNKNGIDALTALDFVFNLVHLRKRKSGIVFVCFAFSRDNEFIFSGLPVALKDKLFQAPLIKQKLDSLETENEEIQDILFSVDKDSQEYELADFENYVNKLSIAELTEVKYKDYSLKLANGKFLTITKGKKSLTIYDIFGFFKPASLRKSVQVWLNQDIPLLDRTNFANVPLLENQELEQLKIHSEIEVKTIAELATKLNAELEKCNIKLSRFHGATAVTTHLLSKSNARNYYHKYKHKRQLSPEANKAVLQSYYGGRAEQFKIGTVKNVSIYDINSAYGFASSLLPVMLSKPYYTKRWIPEFFSIWFCEYDFTALGCYFGYLPNRENDRITYKLKGKGYFWQPEIAFVLQHFPECIEIKNGFVLDYKKAPFTKDIEEFYKLRNELKRNKNPLEKILKLAISSIYGKFCQHNGKGSYFNLFYAGSITSCTRRQLLDATLGFERETVCFLTDAIHTTAKLNVELSNELGAYKLEQYDKIQYIDNGVYQTYKNGKVIKTKTKGFRHFNFEKAFLQLAKTQNYEALAEFFIGHNLHQMALFTQGKYLEDFAVNKNTQPLELNNRNFVNNGTDITNGFIDSQALKLYADRESGLYKKSRYKDCDFSLDTIEARRV